jgi:hypothetical protein
MKLSLEHELAARIDVDKLMMNRNLALGGAAASLIILLSVYQTGLRIAPVWPGMAEWLYGPQPRYYELYGGYFALYGAAIAMPFWLAISVVYELYIVMGDDSFAHMRRKPATAFLAILLCIAFFAQLASVSGLFMHLLTDALWWFLGASAAASILAFAQYFYFERWWKKRDGTEQITKADHD